MTNALGAARKTPALCISIAVLAVVAIAATFAAPAAGGNPGWGLLDDARKSKTRPRLPGKAILVNGRAVPPAERAAGGQEGDRRGEQDPHQALHLRRRPRPLVGRRLRLLRRGQLRPPRRQPDHQPDALRLPRRLGQRRQRPLDHGLRQRRPRLRGDRRPPLGHRRQHQRHRPPVAQIPRAQQRVGPSPPATPTGTSSYRRPDRWREGRDPLCQTLKKRRHHGETVVWQRGSRPSPPTTQPDS